MTDMLEIRKEDVVLEIGPGLGYQRRSSPTGAQVYAWEIIEALAQQP